jgi:hypothetical protein
VAVIFIDCQFIFIRNKMQTKSDITKITFFGFQKKPERLAVCVVNVINDATCKDIHKIFRNDALKIIKLTACAPRH